MRRREAATRRWRTHRARPVVESLEGRQLLNDPEKADREYHLHDEAERPPPPQKLVDKMRVGQARDHEKSNGQGADGGKEHQAVFHGLLVHLGPKVHRQFGAE